MSYIVPLDWNEGVKYQLPPAVEKKKNNTTVLKKVQNVQSRIEAALFFYNAFNSLNL